MRAMANRKETKNTYDIPSLKELNAFIQYTYPDLDTELVKGEGYFYLIGDLLEAESILVPYLKHFDRARWIEEIDDRVSKYMMSSSSKFRDQ